MTKFLTSLSMLIALAYQLCTEGCQRCFNTTDCGLCDPFRLYTLKKGLCVKSNIPSCSVIDSNGKCVSCKQFDQFVNKTANSCDTITPQKIVTNCATHESPGICSECRTDFFIYNGFCFPISVSIQNCAIQSSESRCLKCNDGYEISANQTSCVQFTTIPNCQSYIPNKCLQCKPGYQLEPNGYLIQLLKSDTFDADLASIFYTKGILNNLKWGSCRPIPNNPCFEYSNDRNCSKCFDGFILNSQFICQPIKIPKIDNCYRYGTFNTCIECEREFFLQKETICLPIVPVANCTVYDSSAISTTCIACDSTTFLTNKGICVQRTNIIIANCLELSSISDGCMTCKIGYTPTPDGVFCLPSIPNCQTVIMSTTADPKSPILTCQKCQNTFYLDGTGLNCFLGSVASCQVYAKSSDTCESCKNGFYLKEGVCHAHELVPYCILYDFFTPRLCLECSVNLAPMTLSNNCVSIFTQNCQAYDRNGHCSECEEKYELDTTTFKCNIIAAEEHCVVKIEGICLKCEIGFVFGIDGLCRKPLSSLKENCLSPTYTKTDTVLFEQCDICASNSLPINHESSGICIEPKEIIDTNAEPVILNCVSYKYDISTKKYRCIRCNNDYVLSENSCIANVCPENLSTLYPFTLTRTQSTRGSSSSKFAFESFNICSTKISNCNVATPSVIQQASGSIAYGCVVCDSSFVNFVSFSDLKDNYNTPKGPNSFLPSVTCLNPSTKTYLGQASSPISSVSNCAYVYSTSGYTNYIGCLKCKHGYSGPAVNHIGNCEILMANISGCTTCRQGFYLFSSTQCKPIVPIVNCMKYDQSASYVKCTTCNDNYYITTNSATNPPTTSCTPRTKLDSHCLVYSLTLDTCTSCRGEYTILNGICIAKTAGCVQMKASGQTYICDVCQASKYYVNNGVCVLGNQANCAAYKATTNTCDVCNEGYYVSNGSCFQHIPLINCIKYSKTIANSCDTCSIDSLKFNVVRTCKRVNANINCLSYENESTCLLCNPGYEFNSDRTLCTKISGTCEISQGVDLNNDGTISSSDTDTLTSKILNTCTKCPTGSLLYPYPKSYSFLNIQGTQTTGTVITRNCGPSTLSFTSQYCSRTLTGLTTLEQYKECQSGCSSGYLPMSFKNFHMCIETSYLAFRTFAIVANCLTYKANSEAGNMYVCSQCVYPYVLSSNTCIKKCTDVGKYVQMYKFTFDNVDTPTLFTFLHSPLCTAPPADNYVLPTECTHTTPEYPVLPGFKVGCIVCDDATNFALFSYPEQYPVLTPINPFDPSKAILSPFYPYPAIYKCRANTETTVLGTLGEGTNKVTNCKYYGHYSTPTEADYCTRCDFGFNGKVLSNENFEGFIDLCTAFATCDANTIYEGLQSSPDLTSSLGSLELLFSCHKCTDPTEIPVSFVSRSSTTKKVKGIRPFMIPNTENANLSTLVTSGLEMENNLCLNPDPITNLGMTEGTIPSNCALVVVTVDNSKNATQPEGTDWTTMSALCVACKPGFAPTFSTEVGFTQNIIACTAITNCDPTNAGKWLNMCSTCIFEANMTLKTIKFDVCTTATEANCLAAEGAVCRICKKGFWLTFDNKCVLQEAPVCDTNFVLKNSYFEFAKNAQGQYSFSKDLACLYLSEPIVGCQACTNLPDSVLIKIDPTIDTFIPEMACTKNNLITDVSLLGLSANCEIYAYTGVGVIYCKQCKNTHVLSTTATCELLTADLANCRVANVTSAKCAECNDLYSNIQGLCKLATSLTLSNCTKILANSMLSQSILCEKCNSLYSMTTSKTSCTFLPTYDSNCATFLDARCTKCKPGFGLLYNTDSANPNCFFVGNTYASYDGVIQHDPGCSSLISGSSPSLSFDSYNLACESCINSGFYISSQTIAKTHCYSFMYNKSPTTNCATYFTTSQPAYPTIRNSCKSCLDPIKYYYSSSSTTCIIRTVVAFCKEYSASSNVCVKCFDNYLLSNNALVCTEIIVPTYLSTKVYTIGYIDSCAPMQECDASAEFQGLQAPLSMLFSCHKCLDWNQIPFIAVKASAGFTSISGISEYSAMVTSGSFEKGFGSKGVECIYPIGPNFGISYQLFTFPTNCGLGMINVAVTPDASHSSFTANVNPDKIAVICVACRPGYKPDYSLLTNLAQIPYMIGKCTFIQGCKGFEWFNLCSRCDEGWVYQYSPTKGVQYDTCITFSAFDDCFAAEIVDQSKFCRICKTGLSLNRDGICEKLLPPKCTSFSQQTYMAANEIGTFLVLKPQGEGCTTCQEPFLPVISTLSTFVCTRSNYIVDGFTKLSANYLKNCLYYKVNPETNELGCAKCNANSMITNTHTCVLYTSQLESCDVANNSGTCAKCRLNYSLVNAKCVFQNLPNCLEYNPIDNLICTKCINKYYLSSNICMTGKISNCLEYENEIKCASCTRGFSLYKKQNSVDQCIPNYLPLNCEKFDPVHFLDHRLTCLECKAGMYPVDIDPAKFTSTCYPYSYVPNCADYDYKTSFTDSTLLCKKCDDLYFVNKILNSCALRKLKILNCQEIEIDQDACKICLENFALANNATSCIPQPSGILNCFEYSPLNTCTKCQKGYYLNQTTCNPLPSNITVPNCQLFGPDIKCAECEPDFFLISENNCTKVLAKNCSTYKSLTACDKCPLNFKLVTEGSLTNCIFSILPFCQTMNPNLSSCNLCQANYYPNATGCVETNITVSDCIYYSANGVCSQCKIGFILQILDVNTTCTKIPASLAIQDPFCDSFEIGKSKPCALCNVGYVFSNSSCQLCPSNKNEMVCLICDPDKIEKCLVCFSGYYMDFKGNCIKYQEDSLVDSSSKVKSGDRILYSVMMIIIFITMICL